jgi:hypothetical protein
VDTIGYTGINGWFAKRIELSEGSNDAPETPSFIPVAYPSGGNTILSASTTCELLWARIPIHRE